MATSTLLLGANLPDLDVLSTAWGPVATLSVRRGWTHGVLALIVLPVILTGAVVAWDRLVRTRGAVARPEADARQILLLAYLAVATHPVLDYLNVYGMRWFMPFLDRWYYGDTIYIVDLGIWGVLAAGLLLSRRARRLGGQRPSLWSRGALLVVVSYVGLMAIGTRVARSLVQAELGSDARTARFMVGPVPINPFIRSVVVARQDTITFGSVRLGLRPSLRWQARSLPVNRTAAEAAGVYDLTAARRFLHWARFPFFVIDEREDSTIVHIIDARYTVEAKARFGALRVALSGNASASGEGGQEKAPRTEVQGAVAR